MLAGTTLQEMRLVALAMPLEVGITTPAAATKTRTGTPTMAEVEATRPLAAGSHQRVTKSEPIRGLSGEMTTSEEMADGVI